MQSLLDSGFVIALLSEDDRHHLACADVFDRETDMLLPIVTLPEIAYMMARHRKRTVFASFLRSVSDDLIPVVYPEPTDLARASQIMMQYADLNVDFVDCVIMATAERLNIERILTIDQRDFRVFRPAHIPAFTILP